MDSARTSFLAAAAGLLLLAPPVPATANPLHLVIEGLVTGSASGGPAPGKPLKLELRLESSALSTLLSYPRLITNDAIRVGLELPGPDHHYHDSVGFRAIPVYVDGETGDIVPPEDVDLQNPNLRVQVLLEFEAYKERGGGEAPDSVWARLRLWYPTTTPLEGMLGDANDFLGALQGGEVEHRKGGETVLTGALVPEADTGLLLGLGLAALAASRTRGRRESARGRLSGA